MRGLTREYVLRRFLMFLLTVWLGATVLFIIPRLAPGDPVTAMVTRMMQRSYVEDAQAIITAWKARFGLEAPLGIQYLRYMFNLVRGDLGYSLAFFPTTVGEMIADALPWTIGLLSVATVISFILGNLVGALMGWRGTPNWLRNLLPVTLLFTSIPYFMLAMLLIYLFAFMLKWLPISGGYGRGVQIGLNWPFIRSVIEHAILPAASIVVTSMGFWALGMRGMMITTDGEAGAAQEQSEIPRQRRFVAQQRADFDQPPDAPHGRRLAPTAPGPGADGAHLERRDRAGNAGPRGVGGAAALWATGVRDPDSGPGWGHPAAAGRVGSGGGGVSFAPAALGRVT